MLQDAIGHLESLRWLIIPELHAGHRQTLVTKSGCLVGVMC